MKKVLSAKEKLLIAIFIEYQNDIPNMERLNFKELEIEGDVLHSALIKLQNEGLIHDFKPVTGGGRMISFDKRALMPTKEGLSWAEELLELTKEQTSIDKLNSAIKMLAAWGLDNIKDVAARTVAEILKQ